MFESSEKYRKYLVELITRDNNIFSVWFTDLENDEDLLLVSQDKLVCFEKPENIRRWIIDNFRSVLDKENFIKWCKEEDFSRPYSKIDFRLLPNFSNGIFSNRESALQLIDSLNLIEDLFEQLDLHLFLMITNSAELINLKDDIYSIYFWNEHKKMQWKPRKNISINMNLIYQEFIRHIDVVDRNYGRITGG